jgi:type II secretory ATPase GspE/PulE/Tfp pilus assembly ATPase PilB-like protein
MSQDARRDEELATQRRASILRLSYINTATDNKPLYPHLLGLSELYNLKVIPIHADEHQIEFGVTNNTSQHTMDALRHRFPDQRVAFGLISDIGYREYMRLYDPPKQVVYQDISLEKAGSRDLIESVSHTLEQVRADDMLGYLVQQAHRLNASDIHLETGDVAVRIRFRIDGVLQPIAILQKDKYKALISAIASSANISTASDQAQQGHIARDVSMADGSMVSVNVRVETVQTVHEMDVVMRLFNMSQDMYQLDRLDLSPPERAVVDDIISRPSGLVLVVGPTGSGKTTTLYSMLNSLNNEQRKIITIEDPVEYQLQGVTQISVATKSSKDIDFAENLRAVLRLDPDIVMVGEIRDLDTAQTAMQAALTGHLVLSTFHAAGAAAALTRMGEIIGKNPIFVSAIRLVMAQRLVRRLDDTTKIPYQPDQATFNHIKSIVDTLPADMERPSLDNLTLYKPGQSDGNPYGYRGQVPLREQFVMSGQIQQLLEHKATIATIQEIEQAAAASGMHTMLQDGILKVISGQTTLEEIYRVVG